MRRPTGGRAILHTDELTYSVIAPMDEPRVAGGVLESYRRLSAALLRGLEALNVPPSGDFATLNVPTLNVQTLNAPGPVCFEVASDHEITAGGRKLIGSAQVRKKGVVLQHGSLPLAGDIARICEALVFPDEVAREAARARVRARAATVAEVLGAEVAWETAARAIASGFEQMLGVRLTVGGLSRQEGARAEQLVGERYGSGAWTRRL
ncbi:MAG: lipoate--protein ligase family protein [Chloroflexi bacterium]|nr:lipoate--protein ligase family protein [Chloroflexota bacterium]